ncbi:phage minor head protein [Thermodesulfovibrio thiophilus]|uniref:phage minor head protein n=1 Tax=Thermodesulfovibrio thiophilus TaxID=340095 RepID=UPI00041F4C0C|nr:phage minor head protein [Thermodesulfovibrio thiophilus]
MTEQDKDIESALNIVLPALEAGLQKALSETLKKARYFISQQDLSRYIMSMLESHMKLSQKQLDALNKLLEKIYTKEHAAFPVSTKLTISDERAISYATKLHDFYLGRFFQGDREIRLDSVKWMSNYYLKKGYPAGKNQEGARKFLDEFGNYLSQRTETKARQIVDTTVNYLRNSSRIKAMQKIRIKKYRWDATGDRLTCPACRSMDGRVFDTGEAVRVIEMLEASEDPALIKELRPIQTDVQKGSSSRLPTRMPPLHPDCRCRAVAFFEEETVMTTVERPTWAKDTPAQRELEEEFRALTNEERLNRIRAHMGSSWLRPATGGGGENAYKEAKNDLERHFIKHGKDLGFKDIDTYSKASHDIIKEPEEVYVEKGRDGTVYHFIKDGKVVVSNDDALKIESFYKFDERWRSFKRDGIIRML